MEREDIELLGLTEFAEALDWTVGKLAMNLKRNTDRFPEPIARLRCGPIWLKEDVLDYMMAEIARREDLLKRLGKPQ